MNKMRLFWIGASIVLFVSVVVGVFFVRRQAIQNVAMIDGILISGGEIVDWEERLKSTLWWYPENGQARLQLGFLLARDERFAEAAVVLEPVLPTSMFHREATFARAKALLSDGQYELGEVVLREHVTVYNRSMDGWELYSALLAEQLRRDDLIEDLQARIIEIPSSFQFLPLHFKAVAEFPQAQKFESRLLAVNAVHPKQSCVVAALGKVAWLKGERDRASFFFTELLECELLHPRSIVWAAEFFLETRDFDKAEATLRLIEVSKSLTPAESAKYLRVRSRLALARQDYQLALEQIDQSIRLRSYDATSHSHRASVLRYLKRVSEATEANMIAAKYGSIDDELGKLASNIGQVPPPPDVVRRISELLRQIGHSEVADAWVRLERSMVAQ